MPPKNIKEKLSWKEIVAKNSDALKFIPEQFIPKFIEWKKKREEFNKELEIVAKHEIEMATMFNNNMLELRQYFADAGIEIWQKELNVEKSALKDGEFIVVISDGQK
jgi:Na+-translocating ferredoxin:NAD+ oxidoreductase RnfC subunit